MFSVSIFSSTARRKSPSLKNCRSKSRVARCPGYPSKGPARYVLELNAGKAAELGVKTGDELLLFID